MIYLKYFDQHADYEDYIEDSHKILPNVSYCGDNKDVHYNKKNLVIAKYNVMPLFSSVKMYIDDFPQELADDEYDGDMSAFKQYWIDNIGGNYLNEYSYTGETFIYDDNEYYLWELTEDENDVKYLLTDTLDFTGKSLEDDLDNDYCPFVYILDSDKEIAYDNEDKSNYVLVGVRYTYKPKIYIDDFPQDYVDDEYDGDIDTFKQDWVDNIGLNDMNEYSYTGETFTYGGDEYYLWELTVEEGNEETNVRYLLTDTLDFTGKSLEDDLDNDYCPFVYILTYDKQVSYDNEEKSNYVLVGVRGNDGDTRYNTKIFYNGMNISEIEIDRVVQPSITENYIFHTTGEHTIKYKLINQTSIYNGMFQKCITLKRVKIPSTVVSIGSSAFFGCTGLTSITIPNSVTTIGNNAFNGCSGLTNVTIPNSVTTIGSAAFNGCSGLTSITIGNGVTTIGDNAFTACTGLTSITIGNGVTTIGNNAFNGCTGLTSVNIGNGITTIDTFSFYYCKGLTSITIPNSVTTIANYAFTDCSSLTSITIPKSVTTIGDWVFTYCSKLTSVTVEATIPPTLGTSVFNHNASGRKIYVPNESVATYKAASGWSDYAADIEAIS